MEKEVDDMDHYSNTSLECGARGIHAPKLQTFLLPCPSYRLSSIRNSYLKNTFTQNKKSLELDPLKHIKNMACFRGESKEPHFVLVPLLAQGHLIPMVDLGHILAEHGVRISLIITPANADRIQPIIKQAKEANLTIQFVELSFPTVKFGLPPRSESLDCITDHSLVRGFFDAIFSLHEPLEDFLESLERPPDCMITDKCNGWTGPVARKFGIPRVIFHGPSCFYISTEHNIVHHKVYDRITDENEYITVPDFPIKLEVNKFQTPGFLNVPQLEDINKKCLEEESTADGVIINTFLELEQLVVENYENVIGKKVWAIGPIFLYNKDCEMNVGRGNKEAIDQRDRVLTWLNGRDAASVVYISSGSMVNTRTQQLMEFGSALEASNKPFIWVIKKNEMNPEVEKWFSEEFKERTKDRGLIIVGWAPQMVILSHMAIGCFITHCGWNSILEAISMGVPMITWPRFADQFVNEKLVVDVLKIGVSLGVKVPDYAIFDVVTVKSNDIRKAVSALMDGGMEADERRQRIRDFSEKAKKAMEEGGSSYINLTDFIHYFTEPEARYQMKNGH